MKEKYISTLISKKRKLMNEIEKVEEDLKIVEKYDFIEYNQAIHLLMDRENIEFKPYIEEYWNGGDGRGNNPFSEKECVAVKINGAGYYCSIKDYQELIIFLKKYYQDDKINKIENIVVFEDKIEKKIPENNTEKEKLKKAKLKTKNLENEIGRLKFEINHKEDIDNYLFGWKWFCLIYILIFGTKIGSKYNQIEMVLAKVNSNENYENEILYIILTSVPYIFGVIYTIVMFLYFLSKKRYEHYSFILINLYLVICLVIFIFGG